MPGHSQLTVDLLSAEVAEIASLGIPAVILFGIPSEKDAVGSDACDENGIVAEAVRAIKAGNSDLLVITDEIYSELTFEGEHASIAALPGMAERTPRIRAT